MTTATVAPSSRRRGLFLVGGALLLAVPVLSVGCLADTTTEGEGDRVAQSDADALAMIKDYPHRAVCGDPLPGYARCHARVRIDGEGNVVSNATPSGLTPANLQAAYAIPTTGGAGVTVAIVDAQDDPNAESDLAVYRAQFGLPPCTTANGCFKKVNESGQASPLPSGDTGWAGEISLDLDMVSAACPNCKILLVEATSASNSDLGAAVNTAAALGATVISNSYGGSESSSDTTYDTQYYHHPGVTILASSGDSGYGAQYPATGEYVIAVGGTSLVQSSSSRGWTEGAWSSGGSGCSKYAAKPSFQTDTGCSKRTEADVSAVADPNTGVAVYDTYGASGWQVYGGTSAASPLVAGILAASGKAGVDNSWPYANTGDFYDVTTGSNGSCTTKYLCTAGVGYDGPTGWGTPNGAAINGSGTSSSSSSSSSSTSSSSSSSGSSSSSSSSSSSTSTSSSSSSSSSSSGGGTCAHNICSTGTRLKATCNACADDICTQDSYCCRVKWDSICVQEVGTICGETCN
jgi:hypothetical protein